MAQGVGVQGQGQATHEHALGTQCATPKCAPALSSPPRLVFP